MIIGFLSDAHGNGLAVGRCLEALKQTEAEQIYFLGDSVGYLPNEDAVLTELHAASVVCLRGNHEEMLLGNVPFTDAQDAVYRLRLVRSRLLPSWTAWIETWPIRRELTIQGTRLLLVHGSPWDPASGYVYPDSDLTSFINLPYDLLLLGHTHRPFIRSIGTMTVVNVGSCGLPRDAGHLSSCAIYDTDTKRVEILRVEFDAEGLVSEIEDRIHGSVVECLRRRPVNHVVGRVIDV